MNWHERFKTIEIMKEYQILVSGYRNGYLTTELIKVDGLSIEDAAFKAEQKSSLDGAVARA